MEITVSVGRSADRPEPIPVTVECRDGDSCKTISICLIPHSDKLTLIFGRDSSPVTSVPTLNEIINLKIRAEQKPNTRRGYVSLLNYCLRRLPTDMMQCKFSADTAGAFLMAIEEDFPGLSSMKRSLVIRFKAVLSYAAKSMPCLQVPQIRTPPAPKSGSTRNIPFPILRELHALYSRLKAEDPELNDTATLSMAMFFLSIAFQGLAPVDLAYLKLSNIRIIGNIISLSTYRHKTGVPVDIHTPCNVALGEIQALSKGKSPDDYLIPCFNKRAGLNSAQANMRIANFFRKHSQIINRMAAENGIGLLHPLSYYCARHAFCNLADSLDIPRHQIQLLVGHKTTVLERSYLRSLTPEEQSGIIGKIFRLMEQ